MDWVKIDKGYLFCQPGRILTRYRRARQPLSPMAMLIMPSRPSGDRHPKRWLLWRRAMAMVQLAVIKARLAMARLMRLACTNWHGTIWPYVRQRPAQPNWLIATGVDEKQIPPVRWKLAVVFFILKPLLACLSFVIPTRRMK